MTHRRGAPRRSPAAPSARFDRRTSTTQRRSRTAASDRSADSENVRSAARGTARTIVPEPSVRSGSRRPQPKDRSAFGRRLLVPILVPIRGDLMSSEPPPESHIHTGRPDLPWLVTPSNPVRCGNPTLARFDSGAAPYRTFPAQLSTSSAAAPELSPQLSPERVGERSRDRSGAARARPQPTTRGDQHRPAAPGSARLGLQHRCCD
jgi:hypothetical protein